MRASTFASSRIVAAECRRWYMRNKGQARSRPEQFSGAATEVVPANVRPVRAGEDGPVGGVVARSGRPSISRTSKTPDPPGAGDTTRGADFAIVFLP